VHDGAAGRPFLEEVSYQVVQDLLLLLLDAGLEPHISMDPYFTVDIYSSYFRRQNVFPFEKKILSDMVVGTL
jgi:hypothetical protein